MTVRRWAALSAAAFVVLGLGGCSSTDSASAQPSHETSAIASRCLDRENKALAAAQRLAATNNEADYPAAQDAVDEANAALDAAACPRPSVAPLPSTGTSVAAAGCMTVPAAMLDFLGHAVDPAARVQDLQLHDAAAVITSAVGTVGGRPLRYYYVAAAGVDPLRGEPGVGVWAATSLDGPREDVLGVGGTLTAGPGGSLFRTADGTDAAYDRNEPDFDRALACAGHPVR